MGALNLAEPPLADLSRYVRRDKAGTSSFEVSVKGARCANCIGKIETGVKALPGVADARLNLSTGKLLASWQDNAVDPDLVLRRVRNLGYEAQPYEAPQVKDETEREGRFLLRCLAVAAFGTIFVVGLTDAVWWGGDDLSASLRHTFFLLAGTVAIPVTLYSGQPFFRPAWNSLRARSTSMDVSISAALLLTLGLSLYQTLTFKDKAISMRPRCWRFCCLSAAILIFTCATRRKVRQSISWPCNPSSASASGRTGSSRSSPARTSCLAIGFCWRRANALPSMRRWR